MEENECQQTNKSLYSFHRESPKWGGKQRRKKGEKVRGKGEGEKVGGRGGRSEVEGLFPRWALKALNLDLLGR